MKAFVIKLKENCYWLGGFYGKSNYDDIAHAKVYHLKSQAEKQCKLINETYNYNAQVVEITMEEVNQNLIPTNYDNLSIEDKLKYREIQVRIALDRDVEYDNKITKLEFTVKRLEEELAKKDKMVDIACSKLVDFEYEQKESVHSAQFWKERLETLATQELEKEEL